MKPALNLFLLFFVLGYFACSNTPTEKTSVQDEVQVVEQEKKEEIPTASPTTEATKEEVATHTPDTKVSAEKTPKVNQPKEARRENAKPKKVNLQGNVDANSSSSTSSKEETPEVKVEPVIENTSEELKEASKTTPEIKKETQKTVQKDLSHEIWDQLLRQNVSASGKVNYKGFKAKETELDKYLKLLADNPIQPSWSRGQKMAYWINAYNAFTVKLIVKNYPVTSITKLHGGKPWDAKWIKLGEKTYTLNNIENDILRPKYKDARIHFAVNCAAHSCPPLLNRAWTAANLQRYFEQQAKKFVNNSKFNKIAADKVEISKIFEWYAGDFGNIIEYLNKYSNTKINADAQVAYMEYDWALNE